MRSLKFVRALMVFAAFAATVAGGAAKAENTAQMIVLDGIQSYDVVGTPGNSVVVMDVGSLSTITGLSWNFTFTSYEPSKQTDFEVHFGTSAGLTDVVLAPGANSSSNTRHYASNLDLESLGQSFNVGTDGKLYLEFAEAFKDLGAGVADGQWNTGILIVYYDNHLAAAVPEPETYAMMLLGLGMVGAIARRRRRV